MRGVSLSTKKSAAERFTDFITKELRENKVRFLTVIGFVLGFIILGVFTYGRFQKIKSEGSDRLAYAYMALGAGQIQQGVTYLNDTILFYTNSPASSHARLVKSDMLIEHKEYDQAEVLLKDAVEKSKPESFKPLAVSRLIYLYDEKGDYPNAILYSNEFINKYKNHFLIRDVYINLGRYYELSGSAEDARRVYNEILVTYPASPEADVAARKLEALK